MKRFAVLARNPWARGLLVLALLGSAIAAIWWRGPEWNTVYHAFDAVSWGTGGHGAWVELSMPDRVVDPEAAPP